MIKYQMLFIEFIDNQVFNTIIKEGNTDETDQNNDSQLLHIGYELNLHHTIRVYFG